MPYELRTNPDEIELLVSSPDREGLFRDALTGVLEAVYGAPLVSVVIPVYGKIDYTRRCLASIERHAPGLPFEVIVVDDASPDDSAAVLRTCGGITLLQNEVNLGFIRSCNRGAAAARRARGEAVGGETAGAGLAANESGMARSESNIARRQARAPRTVP